MGTIMVAIDGSEHANRALTDAVALFGKDADYVLVSVVPASALSSMFGSTAEGTPTQAGTGSTGMPLVPTPGGEAAQEEAAYGYYRTAQRQAASIAGISAAHVIDEARPGKRRIGRAICEAAGEHGADVIVVGSHGSSYAGEAMLGSVSQYVLHNATCPVLVSRAES
jgi:nucleotide-binding universal stress UspA family protein